MSRGEIVKKRCDNFTFQFNSNQFKLLVVLVLMSDELQNKESSFHNKLISRTKFDLKIMCRGEV